jgi:ribokinase
MFERGHSLAAVTLGDGGSVAVDASGEHAVGAFAVDAVDTTGAGDAFCGALAVRLAEGAELDDAMRFANAAGALACTKHGAYPSMPYREDVEALLREQGSSR